MKIYVDEKTLNNDDGSGGLEIWIPGVQGNPADGGKDGCPVFIESYNGDIRVCVWNGKEDPTIFTLKQGR